MADKNQFIFGRKNYIIMFIGLAVIALGYILMIGGGSEDPNVFNPEIFAPRRIVVAPTLILIGFAIEAYAIMYREKSAKSE
jgi:NADH:ubiquinone oxidoreductase subunit K